MPRIISFVFLKKWLIDDAEPLKISGRYACTSAVCSAYATRRRVRAARRASSGMRGAWSWLLDLSAQACIGGGLRCRPPRRRTCALEPTIVLARDGVRSSPTTSADDERRDDERDERLRDVAGDLERRRPSVAAALSSASQTTPVTKMFASDAGRSTRPAELHQLVVAEARQAPADEGLDPAERRASSRRRRATPKMTSPRCAACARAKSIACRRTRS